MRRERPETDWADSALVEACLDGDERAFAALIEKYKRMVYAVPLRYHLPPEDAADVFQGVWIDLHRDLSKLRNSEGLRSWLLTASARRSLLVKRRRQRTLLMPENAPELLDPAPDPLEIQSQVQREQILYECVQRLPDRCRKMVTMLFFEQPPRPYKEVAEELGLAEGSIGFIRGRCLERLKKLLKETGF